MIQATGMMWRPKMSRRALRCCNTTSRRSSGDDLGNPVFNLIAETQKQRAQEMSELYGHYLGVKFVETTEDGVTIATGDTRLDDPDVPDVIVLDSFQPWDDNFGEALLHTDPFGETLDPDRLSWFEEAMRQIGQVLLGMVATPDAPPYNVMGQESGVGIPAGQYDDAVAEFPEFQAVPSGPSMLIRVTMTSFRDNICTAGVDRYRCLSIHARRAGGVQRRDHRRASVGFQPVESVLTLYRERHGRRQIIARNDDYSAKTHSSNSNWRRAFTMWR